MNFAICVVPVMSLRAEPSHRSEIVSQMLFGECCEWEEELKGSWIKIYCQYDGYQGWVPINQIYSIPEHIFSAPVKYLAGDWGKEAMVNGHPMHLPLGSPLKGIHTGSMFWGKMFIEYRGSLIQPGNLEIDEKLVKNYAYRYLNTPYLWGGKSPFGIDCSGFTQSVFKLLGLFLPRDAYQQAKMGEGIGFLQSARCGDLAFFDNDQGEIIHVGILLNNLEIIHSAGKVRVDKIDSQGIINGETRQRTHRLRVIKRYF
ncbi:MAG: C40 family peptidase [Chitinophagaceae bacterium]